MPCMKQKSKSVTETPPSESSGTPDALPETLRLRRVKTAGFEETKSRKLLHLPPPRVWSSDADRTAAETAPPLEADTCKPTPTPQTRKPSRRPALCPRRPTKSSIADPAMTRTDVHVVAIIPSWSEPDDAPDEGGINLTTPTMQIVESKNGCYEVIWDHVPAENDMRVRRHSSSAGRALNRVNSKLTEWSGERGALSLAPPPSRPQIVVFPDDDGQAPQYDCVVDDEDMVILAPPNSEVTSTTQSRRPSPCASAPGTRFPSADVEESVGGKLLTPNREMTRPSSLRWLSNIEENDVRFRGHRDSFTLARSRIFNAGGVSPDVFVNRDSISLARKHMDAASHTTSMLRPQIPSNRHIRIVE